VTLVPMEISMYRLAKDIEVHPRRINQIVHGQRGITVKTALRLARSFGNSVRFWMNLQVTYDLAMESANMEGESRRSGSHPAIRPRRELDLRP